MLIRTIADFDGIRRKMFLRFPVWRRCKNCHQVIKIAEVFGDPCNRFVMLSCRRKGGPHRVRDGFRRWLEDGDWQDAVWYLAERPTFRIRTDWKKTRDLKNRKQRIRNRPRVSRGGAVW